MAVGRRLRNIVLLQIDRILSAIDICASDVVGAAEDRIIRIVPRDQRTLVELRVCGTVFCVFQTVLDRAELGCRIVCADIVEVIVSLEALNGSGRTLGKFSAGRNLLLRARRKMVRTHAGVFCGIDKCLRVRDGLLLSRRIRVRE